MVALRDDNQVKALVTSIETKNWDALKPLLKRIADLEKRVKALEAKAPAPAPAIPKKP